jgi:hypothetical protein
MHGNTNKVLEVCNSRYQQIFGEHNSSANHTIVVAHFGEFSQDLVNSITNSVEESMLETGDKKSTIKRMFSILVEGLQNIRLHGEKDVAGNQTSFLIIAKDEEFYYVTLANLIHNRNREKIENRIIEVNKKSEEEVKNLYMEVLTNGIISNKGGAGLGFITMSMKSKNPLGYKIEEIDETLSCFSLNVSINRTK